MTVGPRAMDSGQTSDHQRLVRWIEDHGPAVRGFLFARVRDPSLAEDLLQDVFCNAWEARARFAARGQDRAYLLTIADRLACSAQRGSRRTTELEPRTELTRPRLSAASPLDRQEAALHRET